MKTNVEQFNHLIEEWTKFQGFIDKIEENAGKFAAAVVEKLQEEYVVKQTAVTTQVNEFLTGQRRLLNETKEALATLKHNNAAYDEVEQELSLRHTIGALSTDEFETQLNALRSSMSDYANQVDAYNQEITSIEGMLAQWTELSGQKEVEQVVNKSVETASVQAEAIVDEVDSSLDIGGDDLEPLPDVPELDSALEPIEDLSADFDGDLEFNELDGGPSPFASFPGEDLNFELSNDSLGFDEGLSAELIEPDDLSGSIDLGGMSMDMDPMDGALDGSMGGQDMPAAMLIRDEGVQGSEVVYPFKGTKYRIGRAPDNDIQIKNDSKVSRNHCELSRRGNQFYLVDLGSSNGTMVNGDAFEGEYKLYGGEELKVGETLFRFTIH